MRQYAPKCDIILTHILAKDIDELKKNEKAFLEEKCQARSGIQ